MSTKRKAVDSYKAGICLRGDTIPLHKQHFASAPWALRKCLKIFLSTGLMMSMKIGKIDISKAVLQPEEMHPKGKNYSDPTTIYHLKVGWNFGEQQSDQ